MGLDLSLLPFSRGEHFSQSVLQCFRRESLFEEIMRIEKEKGEDVPKDFASYLSRGREYQEPHYGITVSTPYGEILKHIPMIELTHLSMHEDVLDNVINRAVWAYLEASVCRLPGDYRVALMWH